MKKINRQDFRRETIDLLAGLRLSEAELAGQLEVSVRTIRRWRSGDSGPRPAQFRKLQEVARNAARGALVAREPGGAYGSEVIGRLDQLTKQIADLQENLGRTKADHEREIGELKRAIEALEPKKKEAART